MSKSTGITDQKKPRRRCIACGKGNEKAGLVRFVRSMDGVVKCDASGRVSGRGAYLCAQDECFSVAEKRGRLGAALRCQVSSEEYRRLEEEFKSVCAELAQTA